MTSPAKNEFLQLLVTQLKNQDPLDPIKNEDFVAQLAQFNSLEQMMNLNTNFETLLTIQKLTQASDLVGRNIAWLDEDGNQMSGTVSLIGIEDDSPLLVVLDSSTSTEYHVTMDQLLAIS